MKKYIVTLKGEPFAALEAVSREWAWETWKASISAEELDFYRGHIPRGFGEFDSEPFEGIDLREV